MIVEDEGEEVDEGLEECSYPTSRAEFGDVWRFYPNASTYSPSSHQATHEQLRNDLIEHLLRLKGRTKLEHMHKVGFKIELFYLKT